MKKVKIFGIVIMAVVLAFGLTACGQKKADNGTINVYNAGEYIDESVLKDFEKETGIKVVYDTFASNEDMYVKVTQSSDAYDVLVPSDYMIERLIKEDFLAKLNFDNIKNYEGIDKNVKNTAFDPNNEYSVPYFTGTVGIVYNKALIGKDIDSWDALWNPEFKNQIIMYNSQRDSVAIALKKLGYSMNSSNPQELEEAKQALIEQKPLVYAYLTDDGRDVMVQGDAGLCVMYSGDAALMMSENEDLRYVIPKEGSNIWMDSFVIPKNANNKEAAEKFIDFMCRPEVAVKNAEYCMGYTCPVIKAKELLPEEMRTSQVAYPDYTKLPELEAYKDLGDAVSLYDKVWTEVAATMEEK